MDLTNTTFLDTELGRLLLFGRVIEPARILHIVAALDRLRSSAAPESLQRVQPPAAISADLK